jgi:outer membrane protein insertion porin family
VPRYWPTLESNGSVSERNLAGTGRYTKAAATLGQYIRGIELGFVEPYFFDQRVSAGIDLYARDTLSSLCLSYGTATYGTNLEAGVPLPEDLSFQGALFDLFGARSTWFRA